MDLSAIGRQFGLTDEQTRAALEALTPVVAAGMRRSASSPDGLQDILKSVLAGNRSDALDDENAIQFDRAKASGDDILGQIFGNKEVSRGVADQLSASSGIGAAILKKLLPIVASIVMGQVAKNMGAGSSASPGGGGFGDILKDILGGGGAAGGGTTIPDVNVGGRRPQIPTPSADEATPSSGSGNPLEDILNDILHGGGGNGRVVVKRIPQDQMGDILKDIFGGQFPGGTSTGGSRPQPSPDAINRGRKTLDDVLGGGSKRGNDADILLDSVERSVRRR